jgi:hypothetical protein
VNENDEGNRIERLIVFRNGIVIWEFFVKVVVNFGGSSKCFEVFFINVEEVQREWDGFLCEVWK